LLEIKDGSHKPEVDRKLRLSQLVYVIPRKFQRLTPMFPESGNAERLLGILSYVWVCRKSKMAAIVYDTNSQACTPQTPEVSIAKGMKLTSAIMSVYSRTISGHALDVSLKVFHDRRVIMTHAILVFLHILVP